MNGITVNKTPKQCSEPGQNVIEFINVDQIMTEEGFSQENYILVGVDYDVTNVTSNVEPIQYFLVEEPEKILQGASNSVINNVFETSECSTTQNIAYDNQKCSNEIENFVSSNAIRNVENNANKTVVDSFEYYLEDVKEEDEDNSYEEPYLEEIIDKKECFEEMEVYNSDEYNNLEEKVKMELCGKKFSNRHALGIHSKVRSQYECTVRQKTFERTQVVSDPKKIEEHSKLCYVCGKLFKLNSSLWAHLATHEAKTYECTVCPKKYKNKFTLDNHKLTHTKMAVFQCKYCTQLLASKAELGKHLEHHRARFHECTVCKKSFFQKAWLLKHAEIHQKHECVKCKQNFKNAEDLKTHVENSHGFVKVYRCKTCKKFLPSASALKEHMNVHGARPYECTLCKKLFITELNLTSHIKKHYRPKETSFECTFCGKSIPGESLKDHLNEHGARSYECTSKPLAGNIYKCTVCAKIFAREHTALEHLKRHRERPNECINCKQSFLSQLALEEHKMSCAV